MSNVIEMFSKQVSNVQVTSDLDVAHEVTRYCLDMMLYRKQITQHEYDIATEFTDSAFIWQKLGH